ARILLITRVIDLRRWVVRSFPRLRAFAPSVGRKDSCLQERPPATSSHPVSIQSPSREYLSALANPLSPHYSFAMNSDRSTLVDQPTIMLRNVSQPSAKTRIRCGTTKKMYSHMSQKCQTRAASKPPKSTASQWSCIGLCIAHPVATERSPAAGMEKYAARWSALYFVLKRGCGHSRRASLANGKPR